MKPFRTSGLRLFNPCGLPSFTLGLAASLLAALLPGGVRAQNQPNRTDVADGPLGAIVQVGNTIYIGGRFTRVGPRTGPGVQVSSSGTYTAGLAELSGEGPNNYFGEVGVGAVAPDGSGGWYVGGSFTHVGGVAETNLVHLEADLSVDPNFNAYADEEVTSILVSGSTIYIAGQFASVDGQPRSGLAALNAADGSVTAFNPNVSPASVSGIALSSDGTIVYAAGSFTTVGGVARQNIAAVNATGGSVVTAFNPGASGPLFAVVTSGANVYFAGQFTTAGGQSRTNLACVNGLNGSVTAFNPAPSQTGAGAFVSTLAVSGSTLYVGGLFTTVGGQPRTDLAAVNLADGTVTAFNPSPSSNIRVLTVAGSTIYVGGGFTSIGGQARSYVAALNLDGTVTAFNPSPNAVVIAIGASGSSVYLGGFFSSLGGVVRNNLAAIDATTGHVTAFDPNVGGAVYTLAVSGQLLYLGGSFQSIGGTARSNIGAVDLSTGTVASWNADTDDAVNTLAASSTVLYAGGQFTVIGGQQEFGIAALSLSDGTVSTTFNPGSNGIINVIRLSSDQRTVYVGGGFTGIGGVARNKVAALKSSNGFATSWAPDPTPYSNVLSLLVADPFVYIGGDFTSINGQPRLNLAAVLVSDGSLTGFAPTVGVNNNSAIVYALALSGSTLYVGGGFSVVNNQTCVSLGAVNTADGSLLGFNPLGNVGGIVQALAVAPDGTLYAGGKFAGFDLAPAVGFASFSPTQVSLSSVVSSKTHGSAGTFAIPLSLPGVTGIECRSGGGSSTHTLLFNFASPLASVGGVTLTGGGGVSGGSISSSNPNQYIVTLTGVTNAQTFTVTLTNVTNTTGQVTPSVSVPMGVLLGDVNASGSVNAIDVILTKAQSGQTTTFSNFREDVIPSGAINATDIVAVKARSGTALPSSLNGGPLNVAPGGRATVVEHD